METWLWPVTGILALITAALLVKIYLLKKSAREIREAFAHRLTTETNTLIGISSGDKDMRRLASAVNQQLCRLRKERHRFLMGDLKLKTAVTNISHDLRTPLTAVCGYLELLEQEEIPENARRYVEIIKNRTELLEQLTEELFQYSVPAASKSRPVQKSVSLNHILEESIAAFYTSFQERGIVPCIRIPEKKVMRVLDPSALSRIFSNILSNAVKYSDKDLEISLSETGTVTFVNTASGLNEIQAGRLFDRFYTVETARNSTGLGLSIARTLTEQMGGTISARFEENKLRILLSL